MNVSKGSYFPLLDEGTKNQTIRVRGGSSWRVYYGLLLFFKNLDGILIFRSEKCGNGHNMCSKNVSLHKKKESSR